MKITQEGQGFPPVTIVLESHGEVAAVARALGQSCGGADVLRTQEKYGVRGVDLFPLFDSLDEIAKGKPCRPR